MFCEKIDELDCYNKLIANYPNQPAFMIDIMAWVYINKPDKFDKIIEEFKSNGKQDMIDLETFDIKSILKKED